MARGKGKWIYTDEQNEWLKRNHPLCAMYRDLWKQFNKEFGTSFSLNAIRLHCSRLGLRKPKKQYWVIPSDEEVLWIKENAEMFSRAKKCWDAFCSRFGDKYSYTTFYDLIHRYIPDYNCSRLYTDEQIEWMKNLDVAGRGLEELLCEFNETFDEDRAKSAFGKKLNQLGVFYSSEDKGKCISRNRPNKLPIGSERVSGKGSGLIRVTVDEDGGYKYKQQIVWEEAYGPVPEGYCIIFLDGDNHNCELSNLRCVPRSTFLKLTTEGNYGLGELTELYVDIAGARKAIREEQKK